MFTEAAKEIIVPGVSVILPTHNRAALLKRAMESVLTQSYSDLELLVIDDGSIDDTETFVKQMILSDNRIKYYKLPRNMGVSYARNTGICNSSGKYIAFQDSDDEWLPEKLEKQVLLLETLPEDVWLTYGLVCSIDGDEKKTMNVKCIMPDEPDLFRKMLMISCGDLSLLSCLFRREVFEMSGLFDENLKVSEDREFFIRISRKGKYYCLSEHLVNRYRTKGSLKLGKRNHVNSLKASVLIFLKYFADIKKDRAILMAQLYWICRRLKRLIKGLLRSL